jgi:tRNA pseudouridine38-40 synthase
MRPYNYKLVLSYDGTSFFGWQKTSTGMSIEEALEKALLQLLQEEKISLQAASRTDRGVHAEGQVVNFVTEKALDLRSFHKGMNALLPKEISVKTVEVEEPSFHPTLGCTAKEYHYFLCNSPVQLPFHRHFSWHVSTQLDLEEMQKAALFFLGQKDFSAFCNERSEWDRESVCEIFEVSITPLEENRLRISVVGDHFLYKMVRNIVGTLVYIGMGKLSSDSLPQIFESKDRTQAGVTAPAHGLTLKKVFYNK